MPLAHAHILISRTDNIGDLVLTLPLAGYLKQQFPACKISFLCRAYAAAVVRACRFVDQVLTLEDLAAPAMQKNLGPGMASLGALGPFDVVIFAFPNRRLAQAAKRAKIPVRVGTSHRLYHWLYCNRLAHFGRVNSPLHEAQLNFALLKPLGMDYTPDLAEIPALYGVQASGASPALPWSVEKFHLILHPKSNGNGREWPLDHYVELAKQLQADARVQIWISGSEAEGQQLRELAPELFALPKVASLCGQVDLAGLIEVIGHCGGLVASGTGPLHLAAALGKRTLGLFPPLKPIDPVRWAALGVQAQNLALEMPCQCPPASTCACMAALSVAQVHGVVQDWVAQWGKNREQNQQPSQDRAI